MPRRGPQDTPTRGGVPGTTRKVLDLSGQPCTPTQHLPGSLCLPDRQTDKQMGAQPGLGPHQGVAAREGAQQDPLGEDKELGYLQDRWGWQPWSWRTALGPEDRLQDQ